MSIKLFILQKLSLFFMLSTLITIAVSVFVIYLLSRLISWLQDSAEARKLNDELLRFQKESGGQVR